MKVLKFGGTSLSNADRFKDCALIITHSGNEVAVVLSAPATVTNRLHQMVETACSGKDYSNQFLELKRLVEKILSDIKSDISNTNFGECSDTFNEIFSKLKKFLDGITLISQCPVDIFAAIISSGESLSVSIMSSLLNKKNTPIVILDPQNILIAEGDPLESIINLESSKKSFSISVSKNSIYLMPGFIASDKNRKSVLLGRNGSDYSATALAVLFDAKQCEIWTDVDGIYNCDPNLVIDANLLNTLSYKEAMELSYFGAKVLHPKTISPISQYHIPLLIKNTGAPDAAGTLISDTSVIRKEKVKAISHLEYISMINISGPGMKGMVGMAGRIFSCLSQHRISITLITQSSSEYSISLCIHSKDSKLAIEIIENEFLLEMEKQLLEPIEVNSQLAIVTLIGDGMLQSKGVSARFLSALADASINIIALAQGSSERSISAVIDSNKASAAIKACHQQFFNSNRYIDLFLLGCGGVGTELLAQINRQTEVLAKNQIVVRVCGIANSQKILFNAEGIDLLNWQKFLTDSTEQYFLESLKKQVVENQLINPVIVDCTSNENIANSYLDFFEKGFHVVAANKKANSGCMDYYQKLRSSALTNRRKFLYDTNVGAGLPVIENLQNLILAGDQLLKFNGILSGSLSYIFGEIEAGISFSEVTALAREKGFTEPDPRDDLSGLDVARKLLIIARETGLNIELEDIKIESVLPKQFSLAGDTENFIKRLSEVDNYFKTIINEAKQNGKVLRYVGSIENKKCRVGIQAVDQSDPLYRVKHGENALAFYSQYYQPIPLVLRGYGAGAAVTAAGIYSDILKTMH